MQDRDWFLISKKTVVEIKAIISDVRNAVLYQHTQRDREQTLEKVSSLEHSLDSGLHKSEVIPVDYQEVQQDIVTTEEVTITPIPDLQEIAKSIDATIAFARVNIVDDDVDVMEEIIDRLTAMKESLE